MRRPNLVITHKDPGSASIGVIGQHGRINIAKQTRNGDIEFVLAVTLDDVDKLHIIAQNNPEPQDAP